MTTERARTVRLVSGFLVALLVGAGGVVVDGVAAFCLTPTCQTGPAGPALLGVALLVAVLAYLAPALLVGADRPVPCIAAGALGGAAPFAVLLWFATTPQTGFCF